MISFSGLRFYSLQHAHLQHALAVGMGRHEFDMTPVDLYGCYPADRHVDKAYADWLEDSCHHDPIWDDELQPYYEIIVYDPVSREATNKKVVVRSRGSGGRVVLVEAE